jgi:hypothetical protein
MRVRHTASAGFDDPNLVSCAGPMPVMRLAERAGRHDLAATHVRVAGSAGANPDVKIGVLVAGMVAGADTIDAMDLAASRRQGRRCWSAPTRSPTLDIDDTIKATYGYQKQGAGYGYGWSRA